MIAIFSDIKTAQAFSNKVYDFIMRNCPNAFGDCWQTPVANKDRTEWYVEVPQEYEKDFYPVKEKIQASCLMQLSKANRQLKKLPIDWDEKVIDNITPVIRK